ncbi:hypothetical protein GCM10027276_03490 [Comamonas piscis]
MQRKLRRSNIKAVAALFNLGWHTLKAMDKSLPARIVLEAWQETRLRLALQMDREDQEMRRIRPLQGMELAKRVGSFLCRPADTTKHERIVMLRSKGLSCGVDETIKLASCSAGQVKHMCAMHEVAKNQHKQQNSGLEYYYY